MPERTDRNEAMRLADALERPGVRYAAETEDQAKLRRIKAQAEAAALLRQQAERIAELEAEVQEQARVNGIGAERELALMAEVESLRSAVNAFCYATSWSAQSWKDQPYIKPLFDIARTTHKDEG